MATVSTASVREEFEACESRFRKLREQGKVSPECEILFTGMLALMRLVVTVLMEKVTRKSSKNSGLPSSRTSSDGTAASRRGAKGKGPDRKNAGSSHVRKSTVNERSPVTQCSDCGRNLAGVDVSRHEKRTLTDIVFEVRTTHVEAEIKTCPDCRAETRGPFPDTMPASFQYGNGIVAFAVHLLTAQMVPLRRVAQTMKAFVGHGIAEATLLAWLRRLHEALEPWQEEVVGRLLASPVLHADETSIRIDRKNHWLHSYSAGNLTLSFCHPRRGREAMDGLTVLPRYTGILVHDRWAAYLSYKTCAHAFCGAHLMRDLQFIVDSNGHAWARRMKKLLRKTVREVSGSEERKLTEDAYKETRRRYRAILARGKPELPEPVPRTAGRRGRLARSDAENLHEAFTRHEGEILMFARHAEVPFTNNRSERDIRMAKVKQKVSGCFRSARYAEAYCRISSYLKSMAYQGYDPLAAVEIALGGDAARAITP